MTIPQASVPWQQGYNYGVGADLVSGSPMGMVVDGRNPGGVTGAHGSTAQFQVQRIQTTSDLEQALDIDVSASYGAAAFGAGVNARFSFAKESEVQTSSLFMSVVAKVALEFKQIDDPVLTTNSASLIDNPGAFADRYGNVFVRGLCSGGLFIGVIRVDTTSSVDSEQIAASLQGAYGLFSADATAKFSDLEKNFKTSTYCRMYSEGGPIDLVIADPTDPKEILANVSAFLSAFQKEPEQNSVPYQVTLAPIAIAQGPLPPNDADILHAEDVLKFCAVQRSKLLDNLNLLQLFINNPPKYNFPNGVSPEQLRQTTVDLQSDLDLIASCASAAINHPASAMMPADFGSKQAPPTHFPKAMMPETLPIVKMGSVNLKTVLTLKESQSLSQTAPHNTGSIQLSQSTVR
jgi:hypothetical protein